MMMRKLFMAMMDRCILLVSYRPLATRRLTFDPQPITPYTKTRNSYAYKKSCSRTLILRTASPRLPKRAGQALL
jgi:hypothetical protein